MSVSTRSHKFGRQQQTVREEGDDDYDGEGDGGYGAYGGQ